MKRYMKVALGLIMSAMLLFAFAGCGGEAAKATPADEAAASLQTTLDALKAADSNAIKDLAGGEDVFGEAGEAIGGEEGVDSVLKSMFGHFDYEMGTPEQVDDTHVNVPVTVSNADMQKAVDTWFADLMSYAMSNPDIANDEAALQAKTIELLQASVDKVAEGEDGIVTQDVVIPMVLKDGKWDISEDVDDSVIDAILGGFMTAINNLAGGAAAGATE